MSADGMNLGAEIAAMPPAAREVVGMTVLALATDHVASEQVHCLGDGWRAGELGDGEYLERLEVLIWAGAWSS